MTTRIYVPCDAAALSVGAEAVAKAVHAEIVTRKLDLKLVRNGSRGLLWLEPLVEIETPKGRIGYGPVKASDVKGIFDVGLPLRTLSISAGLTTFPTWPSSSG